MALFRAGCYVFKTFTPVLTNPGLMILSSVNIQVRNAARKGYRERKLRLKLKEKKKKLEASPKNNQLQLKLRSKYQMIQKTEDLKKPPPPNDDIFIINDFNYKKYSIAEAIQFHKEYHHPSVFNNPEAPITVRFDINMTGKKETQVIKPFSGIAPISHPFVIKQKKEVIVFCEPKDVPECLEWGATLAGGVDLIKKIQEGIILPYSYDYVIAHSNMLPNLVPIRGLLKDKLPRAKRGSLTTDLKSAISKFLHGIEYSCVKFDSYHNFGVISSEIGKVSMPTEHLVDNFNCLVKDILSNRPSEERDFITWIWCFSSPSEEQFALDLTKSLPEVTKSEIFSKSKKIENIRKVEEKQKEAENVIEAEEKV